MKNAIVMSKCSHCNGFDSLGPSLGNVYKYKYDISNTINVTGNVKKDFESNLVKWAAFYNRLSPDLRWLLKNLNKFGGW